jgi:hypothetical protein
MFCHLDDTKCDDKHTVDNYEMKKPSKSRCNTFTAKQISAVLTKTSTTQKRKYQKVLVMSRLLSDNLRID